MLIHSYKRIFYSIFPAHSIGLVEGRKEKDLKTFWKWFGPQRTKLIAHAIIGMWKSYQHNFQDHSPGISIIYVKFHV